MNLSRGLTKYTYLYSEVSESFHSWFELTSLRLFSQCGSRENEVILLIITLEGSFEELDTFMGSIVISKVASWFHDPST